MSKLNNGHRRQPIREIVFTLYHTVPRWAGAMREQAEYILGAQLRLESAQD